MPEPAPRRVHYIHRLSPVARERLAGAFVLSALLIVALLFFYSGQGASLFAERFTLTASLHNAQGLAPDAKVFISGVEVGHVKRVDVTEQNDIRLTLELFERFHGLVRTDSRVTLSKLALLGNANVEIRAGNPQLPRVQSGATLPVDEPQTMEQLLAETTPVLSNFKQLVQRLDAIVDAIDPQDVGKSAHSLQASLANIEQVTAQLAQGRGALGAITTNPEVQRDLTGTLRNAQDASADLRRASGDLPELVTRLRVLVEQMNLTLRAIQGVWPVSSTLPEPAAAPLLLPPATQP